MWTLLFAYHSYPYTWAEHLGLIEDIGFMKRSAWLDPEGNSKYETFCPLSANQLRQRLARVRGAGKQSRSTTDEESEGDSKTPLSALELQYDWPLHQMVAYMRRVDGKGRKTFKGLLRMNPLAPDREVKFAIEGSKTPLFGYWFYFAWYNVIVPSLSKTFGTILDVMDTDEMERLLMAKVKM